MSTQNDTIYVPKSYAKEKTFDWGTIIGLSFDMKELNELAKTHAVNGVLRLDVVPRKTPSESSSHSVKVNTWKPKAQDSAAAPTPVKKAAPKTKVVAPVEDTEEEQPPF